MPVTVDLQTIELMPPDLRPWRTGNAGCPYVWRFDAPSPGPSVVVCSLIHGNEFSGALALVRLLEADLRPVSGRLTFVFANVSAFERFDAESPRASRYIDEDLNRVWGDDLAKRPASSAERVRALELLPMLQDADFLLDLHSMQGQSPALMLCGMTERSRAFALELGMPGLVVADRGHANGTRLIEHGPFAAETTEGPVALLLEAGPHWQKASARTAFEVTVRFLRRTGSIDDEIADALAPGLEDGVPRVVEVTHAIVASDAPFRFTRQYPGMEVITEEGTVIAHDGDRPVVTPYADCVLVMPSQKAAPGQTAVRLGRFAAS